MVAWRVFEGRKDTSDDFAVFTYGQLPQDASSTVVQMCACAANRP